MTTRKQIRDAIIARIEAIPEHTGLVTGYAREFLPGKQHKIAVDLNNGDVENGPSISKTNAEVSITILSPAVSNIDDTLDGYAEAIEAAINTDRTLGGLITRLTFDGWRYIREIDETMTGLTLTYRAVYKS